MHLNKKAGLFYTPEQGGGLANLGRSWGWSRALTGEGSHSGHFLNTASTHSLGLEEALLSFRLHRERFSHVTGAEASTQVHSGLHLPLTFGTITFLNPLRVDIVTIAK